MLDAIRVQDALERLACYRESSFCRAYEKAYQKVDNRQYEIEITPHKDSLVTFPTGDPFESVTICAICLTAELNRVMGEVSDAESDQSTT